VIYRLQVPRIIRGGMPVFEPRLEERSWGDNRYVATARGPG
jgi:hypothetical protein